MIFKQHKPAKRTRAKNLNLPIMLNFYQKKPSSAVIFSLCVVITATQGQQKLPVKISPIVIPTTISECASDDNRQASLNFVHNITYDHIIYGGSHPECGPGEWRDVLYLNTSVSNQSCPGDWNLVTSPVRGCGGANNICLAAFSDDIYSAYSKVCGRMIGIGARTPDAFYRFISNQTTIDGNYLDGISITHGASGSRTHIWSFGTGHRKRCPCNNGDRTFAPLPPSEVGNNYFCDRADELDPLWTGESCSSDNPCCSFHNPPYFSVQLPSATTDRIEIRICIDQSQVDETVLILFAEVYVQ